MIDDEFEELKLQLKDELPWLYFRRSKYNYVVCTVKAYIDCFSFIFHFMFIKLIILFLVISDRIIDIILLFVFSKLFHRQLPPQKR